MREQKPKTVFLTPLADFYAKECKRMQGLFDILKQYSDILAEIGVTSFEFATYGYFGRL
jgi:hypothetical protein